MINSRVSSTLFSPKGNESTQVENQTIKNPPEIDIFIVPEGVEPVEEWEV